MATMGWSNEQRSALEREYKRIGYRLGERWPAPPHDTRPDEFLALLRSVKTGSGLQGYVQALRERSG
jgi:hypothetical protein